MDKFKIGEILRLKSGSPKLVVAGVTPSSNRYISNGETVKLDDDVTVTWIAYGTGVSHTYTGPSVVFVRSRD